MTEVTHPILLAYDGSESSAVAIDTAGRLLVEREALVCHVWSGLSRAMLHADPDELIATNHSADSPAPGYASRPTPADRPPDREFRRAGSRLEPGDQDEHTHGVDGRG